VTSLVDLGLPVTMDDLDLALARTFAARFGAVRPARAARP
jgi:lipoyl(octanoyl) transferase